MPASLPVGKRHSAVDLALFVRVDGKLVDAYSVEYAVYDISSGYPGTQVLPVTGTTDVTTTGRQSTGVYGVYDPDESALWTPDTAIDKGLVVWTYTLESGGAEYTAERYFEVLPASVTRSAKHNIVTIADLRDEGLPDTVSDAAAYQHLRTWTERIERYCRQNFHPTLDTLSFMYRAGKNIPLNRTIFALQSMQFTGESDVLDLDDYYVRGVTEFDANNPAIERIAGSNYVFGGRTAKRLNVTAVFGVFDEDTFLPPEPIVTATAATIVKVVNEVDSFSFEAVGAVKREKVDGHEIEYATSSSEVRSGMLAALKSAELRDLLDMYKAPVGIGWIGA